MEYKLTAELPELTEVKMLPDVFARTNDEIAQSLFVYLSVDKQELADVGWCQKNTRLMFVNIDQYASKGRDLIARTFPHCAVVRLSEDGLRNLDNMSREHQKTLRKVAGMFYLIIPLTVSHIDENVCLPCGATFRTRYRYEEGVGTIRSTDMLHVVDIFVGGKAFQGNELGSNYRKMRSLTNMFLRESKRFSGIECGTDFNRDIRHPVQMAHFDAVLEEVFK